MEKPLVRNNRYGVAIVAILLSILLFAGAGGLYWAHETEENCWQQEGVLAVEKYEKLKTRADVLKEINAYGMESSGTNPLKIIDRDPNGCSLGGNGQTVVRLYFSDKDELKKIQVFKYYTVADYEMELLKERQL